MKSPMAARSDPQVLAAAKLTLNHLFVCLQITVLVIASSSECRTDAVNFDFSPSAASIPRPFNQSIASMVSEPEHEFMWIAMMPSAPCEVNRSSLWRRRCGPTTSGSENPIGKSAGDFIQLIRSRLAAIP
jgi:hypothetical protein